MQLVGREWTTDTAMRMITRNSRCSVTKSPIGTFIKVLRNTAGLTVLGAIDYLDKQLGYAVLIVSKLN